MTRPLRLAIAGTGQIAAQGHLPAALACPDVELAALVDPVLERAQALARDWGIAPRLASRVEDVVRDVDAAIVATPNHTHAPVALPLLAAGVSVLIEKPLATSVDDARSIVAAAERAGAVAAVGYSWRFWDSVDLMKELLDEGFFGRVRRFLHQEGSRGGWAPLSAYNLDRKATGGGVVVVTGTHFLDRMLHWFGRPVQCSLADDSEGGPEANALARFVFETRGARVDAQVRFSKTARLAEGFVLESERGLAILREKLHDPIRFRPSDRPGLELELKRRGPPRYPPQQSMYLLQLEDFVRAVREKGEPKVSARAALASVELLAELYAARTPLRGDWYGTRPLAAEPAR